MRVCCKPVLEILQLYAVDIRQVLCSTISWLIETVFLLLLWDLIVGIVVDTHSSV
jgi:TRAP-type C4-dicarboxylate transport system permease small subunit